MSEQPQDLKPRTKAFALRVIRMYSKLSKSDTVAQVLGKQVLRSELPLVRITARRREAVPKPSSFPKLATASRKLKKRSIGSSSSSRASAFPRPEWQICLTKHGN